MDKFTKHQEDAAKLITFLTASWYEKHDIILDLEILQHVAAEVVERKVRDEIENQLRVLNDSQLTAMLCELQELTNVKKKPSSLTKANEWKRTEKDDVH